MTTLEFSFEVPYQRDHRGHYAPIISLRLFHNRAWTSIEALVDTGATWTLIDAALAPELELDRATPIRMESVVGIGGGRITVPMHRIGMQILTTPPVSLGSLEAGLMPNLRGQIGLHLLGRNAMSRLRLAFLQREQRLYFDVE